MKRTKKPLAFALAMMMVFSCMAMPAMAAGEDEGIMPLVPSVECEVCYRSAPRISSTEEEAREEAYRATNCSNLGGAAHTHIPIYTVEVYRCNSCGHRMTVRLRTSYRCVADSAYP